MTTKTKTFLDHEKIDALSLFNEPSLSRLQELLDRALELKGLTMEETAELLAVKSPEALQQLLDCAFQVKKEIYGRRMVLFAPLYTGNACTNNCLYCGFRKDNKSLERVTLSMDEIAKETQSLLSEGHKRVLVLCGESGRYPLDYTIEAIRTIYSVNHEGARIRRINVEIAPMSVEDFRRLKTADIGTYTCFQETYDPQLYAEYHPSGPKADYENRLYAMHNAMEAGIDDVGIGVLFGLGDYKKEVLSILGHANELEDKFGCGPHTVSVPRLEPAPGAPVSESVPYPVSDDDFRKIIAVIRMAMPYTGIILSTREDTSLRNELFRYGVSQVSAGSKTNPGGYAKNNEGTNLQFTLGDHRSLDQVISGLAEDGFIPSFCTGCYRKGRTGNDFMDLAKPGLIKEFCMPNGLVTFAEYLLDYAGPETREKGFRLIDDILENEASEKAQTAVGTALSKMKEEGARDIYL